MLHVEDILKYLICFSAPSLVINAMNASFFSLTSSRRQIAHAVLARSPLKPVCLAAPALLVLPHAARVEGRDVLQPVREARDLVCLVPGEDAEVV